MDDREKVEEQVEDLPVDEQSAEDVKGGAGAGGGVTAEDDWETPTSARAASPKLGRGGWDGNHSEILIAL
jgi:hypothetical protein